MAPAESARDQISILVVDDEESVLRALRRALRNHGYEIHMATSGEDALRILDLHDIGVLVCDQRMPGMVGSEVLAHAFKSSPDTYRITLTGYTDLEAAQRSINDGHVNQFLTKPWHDAHLGAVVREGANAYRMVRENRRLQELTRRQNEQLEAWNQKLEATVEERTRQLNARNEQLQDLQEQLRHSLRDTVAVLAGILEAYDPSLGIHSKRVADLTRIICERLDVPGEVQQEAEFAAYLHDIGLVARLHQRVRGQAPGRAGATRRGVSAAESGWALLSRVHGFEHVARAVRHQEERYDGNGRPDQLEAGQIPFASRVIAICNVYDNALHSSVRPTVVSIEAAQRALTRGMGEALDPEIVEVLLSYLDENKDVALLHHEVELSPKQLDEGMTLSRDLRNVHGVLLLKAHSSMTSDLIRRLRQLGEDQMLLSGVFVRSTELQPDGPEETTEVEAA